MHQPGAGHWNFRLAMANYGFEVLFFDIAGVAGVNGKGSRRGVECRESAIHPAPVLADGHHLRTARPTLSGFYPTKSDQIQVKNSEDNDEDDSPQSDRVDRGTASTLHPSTSLGRGRRILLRQGYGATSIVKVSQGSKLS